MVGFYCPDSQLNPTREGRRPIFLCRRGGQLKSNLNFGFPAVFRFTRPGRRYGQPPPRIFLVWIREKLDTRATGNPRDQQKKSNRPPPPQLFRGAFFSTEADGWYWIFVQCFFSPNFVVSCLFKRFTIDTDEQVPLKGWKKKIQENRR